MVNTFCKSCNHYASCMSWLSIFSKPRPEEYVKWCQVHAKEALESARRECREQETMGKLIGQLYDCSLEVLTRIAVELKEHPEESEKKYSNPQRVRAALEKVLDIRDDAKQIESFYHRQKYREITTGEQLRTAYERLNFAAKYIVVPGTTVEPYSVSVKCAIRRYNHKQPTVRRIIHDDGTGAGYIELIQLPVSGTKEEADAYFHLYVYIKRNMAVYGCTGRSFSCWYKLFQRHSTWWAYHCVGRDI